jgi:frataxin-like iron-binding protein CyaY
MKIHEALTEDPVMSSWINDITLQRNKKDVTMTLGNGTRYIVNNIGEPNFAAWKAAQSKGQFWHSNIRGTFKVRKLM